VTGLVPLVVAAVVGYLLGSVSPAVLVARARGVDLRAVGSGNPGASNAGRALGRRTGVVVALLDIAKGAVPAAGFGAWDHEAGLLAGLAAVLGHVTSPFLRGRGGKGVATAAGAILGSHPLWLPVVLLTWAVVLGATRWIALASVTAAVAVLVVAVVVREDVWWGAGLTAVVLLRHRSNLARGRPPRG
jgi:acyl phosphate:glycerol-3-phosphate acyltransferase